MTTHPSAGGTRRAVDEPAPRRLTISAAPAPTEAECQATIVDAARRTGWMVHHGRPAQTAHGWRTAIQGHKGFPDLVLVHPGNGRHMSGMALFVELKRKPNRLDANQGEWRNAILAAGLDYRLVWVPDELDAFVQELADRAAPS